MKQALQSRHEQVVPLKQTLAAFFLCYRSNPIATTGIVTSTLLMGHIVRTRLDILKPDIGHCQQVRDQQDHHMIQHDADSRRRLLAISQNVWVQNMREGPHWVPASIIEIQGPASYLVQLTSGDVWHWHVTHT